MIISSIDGYINTVSKLLLDVGEACTEYQDRVLRDLPCKTWDRLGAVQLADRAG